MIGLCHVCLTSNIEVSVTKGLIHCSKCNSPKSSVFPGEDTNMLQFEDLPESDPVERTKVLSMIVTDIFEERFHKDMARERVGEVLDKRY